MSEFQHATRQQTSLLSPLEKKALHWFAVKMPPWINSDHLTAIGFLSMVAAGFAYWYSAVDRVTGLLLVGVFLLLNWFGDSLDGTVARQRNLQRHATASISITSSTASARSFSSADSVYPV